MVGPRNSQVQTSYDAFMRELVRMYRLRAILKRTLREKTMRRSAHVIPFKGKALV